MKIEQLALKQFSEITLLFQSRNIPYQIETEGALKNIHVADPYAEQALEELESYFQENYRRSLPIIQRKVLLQYPFSSLNLVMLILLAAFHNYIWGRPEVESWYDFGRFSASDILKGEWYRAVTALTLHKDLSHLLSNLVGLLLFVSPLQMLKGVGLAWSMTLLAGISGNLLNAVFYQAAHYSVGASTAVFGALGVLAVWGGKNGLSGKKQAFAGIAAALGIVAMLGVSPDTDVMAHLFGFFSGVILGLPFRLIEHKKLFANMIFQYGLFLLSLFVLAFFWSSDFQLG